MTVHDLLHILPERGWAVVRDAPASTLMFGSVMGLIKVQKAGPGRQVYEVRLTGLGRKERVALHERRQP